MLLLEDGTQLEGFSFGAEKEVNGEVVFSTGMVGYPGEYNDGYRPALGVLACLGLCPDIQAQMARDGYNSTVDREIHVSASSLAAVMRRIHTLDLLRTSNCFSRA